MRRKRINNYLRRCRKARGLTQKEVADILGLESSAMISRWEKGVSLPETHNAIRLSVIYQTTVDFIFEELRYAIRDKLSQRVNAVLKAKGGGYD